MTPFFSRRCRSLLLIALLLQLGVLRAQSYLPMLQAIQRDSDANPTLLLTRINVDSFKLSGYGLSDSVCKFPAADSLAFVKALQEHGLKEINYVDSARSWLVFDRVQTYRWAGQELVLKQGFFDNAALDDGKVDSGSKKLVIFVSDPHMVNANIPYLKRAILDIFKTKPRAHFYFPGRRIL
jgi:hypothetical protein